MSDGAEPGLIVEGPGPDSLVGVFEDDGDTAYLYLYDESAEEIIRHLHIYDRPPSRVISEDDVFVTWSTDFSKVGVVIDGRMCGIIDRKKGAEKSDAQGIADADWLDGFERE